MYGQSPATQAGVDKCSCGIGSDEHHLPMGEVFRGSEALRDGVLTEHQLRRWYRPIFRDVYVPRRYEQSLVDQTIGAWLWSRRQAVAGHIAP